MKYFLITCIFFLATTINAQPTKKKEDKPPTKAEMDAMMKEMDAAMKDIDPEVKKMMDSMGIQMPGVKNIQKKMSGVSDAQLKTAWEDENRVVPKKDVTRIASIYSAPLSAATIPAYLATAHSKVITKLKPAAKQKGDEIYAIVKASYNTPNAFNNAAAGLWMIGKSQIAIYLMGKACIDDPVVANNLSNYASMLTSAGMEEMAIPLLTSLNKSFPQNSTILNNLGQAWYGLGDMDKAGKYIDSTLRIAAMHPQANATKSSIEESKGNTQGAKDAAVKAVKAGYSKDKEDRLQKLGIPIDDKIITWPFKPENDAFGLSSFKRPDYPKTVAECVTQQPIWDAFKKQCADEIAKLEAQAKTAGEIAYKAQKQRSRQAVELVKYLQQNPGASAQDEQEPLYARQAALQFKKFNEYWDEQYTRHGKKIADFLMQMVTAKNKYDAEMSVLQAADLDQTGEGKPNVDFCPKYRAVANAFLVTYNSGRQLLDEETLRILRRQASEATALLQYIEWPEQFEFTKLKCKLGFLGKLQESNFQSITTWNCILGKAGKNVPLAEFDDVACKYHSTLNLIIGKIQLDCSRMTTTFNTPFLKLGLKQDMNKETFGDQFMNGSVEIGVSAGPSANAGPLKVEANIGAGVRAEFDRTGMTDLIIKGSATVGTGVEVDSKGAGVEVGVEGQVSLVTGKTSVGGSGLFEK